MILPLHRVSEKTIHFSLRMLNPLCCKYPVSNALRQAPTPMLESRSCGAAFVRCIETGDNLHGGGLQSKKPQRPRLSPSAGARPSLPTPASARPSLNGFSSKVGRLCPPRAFRPQTTRARWPLHDFEAFVAYGWRQNHPFGRLLMGGAGCPESHRSATATPSPSPFPLRRGPLLSEHQHRTDITGCRGRRGRLPGLLPGGAARALPVARDRDFGVLLASELDFMLAELHKTVSRLPRAELKAVCPSYGRERLSTRRAAERMGLSGFTAARALDGAVARWATP